MWLRACTHTGLNYIQHLGRGPGVSLIANSRMYIETILVVGVPAQWLKHTTIAQTLHLVAAIIYLNALRKNAVAYERHYGLVADLGLVLVQGSRIHLRAGLIIKQAKPSRENSGHICLAIFTRKMEVA